MLVNLPQELRNICYNYEYKVRKNLMYQMESQNKHNQNDFVMKSKDQKLIGHVPETLVFKLFTLTLCAPTPEEEKKINLNLYFHTSL